MTSRWGVSLRCATSVYYARAAWLLCMCYAQAQVVARVEGRIGSPIMPRIQVEGSPGKVSREGGITTGRNICHGHAMPCHVMYGLTLLYCGIILLYCMSCVVFASLHSYYCINCIRGTDNVCSGTSFSVSFLEVRRLQVTRAAM